MSASGSETIGLDPSQGLAIETLADGAMLVGHVGEGSVLIARRGDEFLAVRAHCTHYGGPLAERLPSASAVRVPTSSMVAIATATVLYVAFMAVSGRRAFSGASPRACES